MPMESPRDSSGIFRQPGLSSGLVGVVYAILDLFFYVALCVVEFTHATTESTHQLRDFLAPEHQQYNDKDDDDLIGAQHADQNILYHNVRLLFKDSNKSRPAR